MSTCFAIRKVGTEDEIIQSGKHLQNIEKTKYQVYQLQCEENLKPTRHDTGSWEESDLNFASNAKNSKKGFYS